jgi:hypothetical protein
MFHQELTKTKKTFSSKRSNVTKPLKPKLTLFLEHFNMTILMESKHILNSELLDMTKEQK